MQQARAYMGRRRRRRAIRHVESEVDASAAPTATATARASAAVLTAPLSLEGGLAAELQPANLVQRVLSLFGNVRPGADLSHFQLPATFNLPKSQLQLYGEIVYCDGDDYLSRCGKGKDSLERFTAVVAWSISTTRPPIFGFAPYNPVLGETHHVSRGSLHVLLEQVCHKPPVSALHATDDGGNVELVWSQHPVPKFNGASIEATVHGKRQVRLPKFNETYEMDCPNLLIRLLPGPSVEWSGTVRIVCKDSGLEAELSYHRSNSFMGMGGDGRCVKGKVFHSSSPQDTVFEIDGYWDRTVSLKDVESGEVLVLYDANLSIANLVTPEVKDEEVKFQLRRKYIALFLFFQANIKFHTFCTCDQVKTWACHLPSRRSSGAKSARLSWQRIGRRLARRSGKSRAQLGALRRRGMRRERCGCPSTSHCPRTRMGTGSAGH
ncbi:oxysterol-binding protein-related protein 4C isoform X2 [Triticum aestivum]|uniref:oxysterol-binding protein-related protein 4C isoform X2 n=1 Tax=Triticum aestivum TaxID=4565 RepID=UPI001D011FBD|nr:oxysterol-binding protein-related protein 4C-like isoform X2 [Triticum aestivum]